MLDKAINLLKNEDIVSMPNETVYGLAGSIFSDKALRKIFATKNRPFFDPLIVHVSSIEEAKKLVKHWHPAIQIIAEKFWPGPLTLVLEKNNLVNDIITSGLTTVALRIPNHLMALELIKGCGFPLAAPSANKFGKTSPTSAQHVRDEFFDEDIFVIDGGPCSVGLESTVLSIEIEDDLTLKLSVLRKGHVKLQEITSLLKLSNYNFKTAIPSDEYSSPGQMKHHYMPKKPLIVLDGVEFGTATLDIIKKVLDQLPSEIESVQIIKPQEIKKVGELILPDNPILAARELYSKLRASSSGDEDIMIFNIQPIHKDNEWDAVVERLLKAATLVLD